MNKYYVPWMERDKRRGTRRIRWWKRVNGEWVKDKGISCGRDAGFARDTLDQVRERLKMAALGEVDLTRPARDCFDAFIRERELENYPPVTLTTYRKSIGPYLQRVVTMADCTPQSLRDWRMAMMTPGANKIQSTDDKKVALMPNTIRRRLMDVRTWLSWAKANGWLMVNPWTELVKPTGRKRASFLPKHKATARFFSDEEIIGIEDAIQENYWKNDTSRAATEKQDQREFLCAWRMTYDAGMREGEVFKARAEDLKRIDGGEGLLTVRSRKGGEEIVRVILLSPRIMSLLPDITSGLFFPRWLLPDGGVDYAKLRWHWEKARRKAKISREPGQPPATFYQGRHTFARRYLEQGGDLRDLKVAMGHSSMRMLDEVYGHIRSSVVIARMRAAQRSAGQWRGKIPLSTVNASDSQSHPDTGTENQNGETRLEIGEK